MKDIPGIKALCYGAITCNVALIGVLLYNTSFSNTTDAIMFVITSFGLLVCILYGVQLLLMKRNYYTHRPITSGARRLLHIARIIQLLYTLGGTLILVGSLLSTYRYWEYDSHRFGLMTAYALILVTIVLNLTIFFKGWRLLKLVRNNYIDEVMATFDVVQTKQ